MLEIEITDPRGQVRIQSVAEPCAIGRAEHCDLRLEGWRVGKEHVRLVRTPQGVIALDRGALGGFTVNGAHVAGEAGPMAPTDIIGIAGFRLRVLDVAKPTAPASDPAIYTALTAVSTPGAPDRTSEVVDAALADLEFQWRRRVHAQLLATMDLRRHDVVQMSDERLRSEATKILAEVLALLADELPDTIDRARLARQVIDEAVGLGPLEELLADESVTEIMVNRFDSIYVERAGRIARYPLAFTSDRAVMAVIERIVTPLGRRIDDASPMVDARLRDGSRVNAIIPPLALRGPVVTVRKFAKRKLNADDLVNYGSLDSAMAIFLQVCVETRKNVIVSGGTGSGKTTLLNILSNYIPAGERIITIEDAAELQLHHEHWIALEARPPNAEGKGAVPIRDLVRNTLRMRPDRIVVGECRGPEALDMLQAMNTGHEGSLTTLHANAPRDALSRLETMVLMAGVDLPLAAIREQVASAVDVIVQQTRFACGSRIVTHVVEVSGMDAGKIQIQDVFRFRADGFDADGRVRGRFTPCDLVPNFYESLRAAGRDLDVEIFRSRSEPHPQQVDAERAR